MKHPLGFARVGQVPAEALPERMQLPGGHRTRRRQGTRRIEQGRRQLRGWSCSRSRGLKALTQSSLGCFVSV
jgi:hypothetical protein